jgi:hypothetical protein
LLPTSEEKFLWWFGFFYFFFFKIKKEEAHNMFLMLDLTFKSLCLISFFVGQEEGVNIMDEYDRKPLYRMLLKCYHHCIH